MKLHLIDIDLFETMIRGTLVALSAGKISVDTATPQIKRYCTDATPIIEALKEAKDYLYDYDSDESMKIHYSVSAALSLLESKPESKPKEQ